MKTHNQNIAHLGSSTLIWDVHGLPWQQIEYTAYGESYADQSPQGDDWKSPYRFTGKEQDAETGLYYYGERYYDPGIGRFLSVDPLAEKFPEFSCYQYASNNPIVCIDIDGMEGYKVTTKDIQSGFKNVKFYIDLKIINNSSASDKTVAVWADLAKKQIEKTFKGYDKNSHTSYSSKVNLNFEKNIKNGEKFALELKDKVTYIQNGREVSVDGHTKEIGNPTENQFQILIPGKSAENWSKEVTEFRFAQTSAHEIGHGFGLRHEKQKDPKNIFNINTDNLMFSWGEGTKLNISQLKYIEHILPEKVQ